MFAYMSVHMSIHMCVHMPKCTSRDMCVYKNANTQVNTSWSTHKPVPLAKLHFFNEHVYTHATHASITHVDAHANTHGNALAQLRSNLVSVSLACLLSLVSSVQIGPAARILLRVRPCRTIASLHVFHHLVHVRVYVRARTRGVE